MAPDAAPHSAGFNPGCKFILFNLAGRRTDFGGPNILPAFYMVFTNHDYNLKKFSEIDYLVKSLKLPD